MIVVVDKEGSRAGRAKPQAGPTRCPFCHADCEPHDDVVVCRSCLSRHHAACWSEGAACASCGAGEGLSAPTELRAPTESAAAAAAPPRTWLGMTRGELGLWVVLIGTSALLLGLIHVMGAFVTMFSEVGVDLPWLTQVALAPARHPLLASLLVSAWVATAALARSHRRAFVALVLGGALLSVPLLVVALFLPLVGLLQGL